jgi:SAM-dependent methyltransferase
MSREYTPAYYDGFKDSSRASAAVVVPMVDAWVRPRTVLDLGCGLGMWLSVWRDAGCDVLGVDGEWVDRSRLAVPADRFVTHDLSRPYQSAGRFDLAMSVEAAEHLPPAAAEPLVQALTTASDVVLFSASIPHQGGAHHLNCQWPDYWAGLFAARGFDVIDGLRPLIWGDERVDWWYRQNIMIYVRGDQLERWPALEAVKRISSPRPARLVHPGMLRVWVDWAMEQSNLYWDLWRSMEAQKAKDGRSGDG